ncbi:hypothetical protein [uncultured Phocaeicola sp.]|uniref:hypothetical protein n=1 Tax=uncultured Phocaeicola sp. TaxID=990718 RepID=UPI001433CBF6|nr:hypothetical protein [uncultured Phocaeicola sp.]GFI01163.1 hypothetical protein IMSAGC004_03574 [Bacteroidaceae bacterium]
MNKVISLIITLLLSAIIPVYRQKEKNVVYKVGVGELLYARQQSQYAESVRTGIINGLSKVKRFRTFGGGFSETEISADIPVLYINGLSTISVLFLKQKQPKTTKEKNPSHHIIADI